MDDPITCRKHFHPYSIFQLENNAQTVLPLCRECTSAPANPLFHIQKQTKSLWQIRQTVQKLRQQMEGNCFLLKPVQTKSLQQTMKMIDLLIGLINSNYQYKDCKNIYSHFKPAIKGGVWMASPKKQYKVSRPRINSSTNKSQLLQFSSLIQQKDHKIHKLLDTISNLKSQTISSNRKDTNSLSALRPKKQIISQTVNLSAKSSLDRKRVKEKFNQQSNFFKKSQLESVQFAKNQLTQQLQLRVRSVLTAQQYFQLLSKAANYPYLKSIKLLIKDYKFDQAKALSILAALQQNKSLKELTIQNYYKLCNNVIFQKIRVFKEVQELGLLKINVLSSQWG